MTKPKAINRKKLVAFVVAVFMQLKKPPAMRVVGISLDQRKNSCVIVYVGLQTTKNNTGGPKNGQE